MDLDKTLRRLAEVRNETQRKLERSRQPDYWEGFREGLDRARRIVLGLDPVKVRATVRQRGKPLSSAVTIETDDYAHGMDGSITRLSHPSFGSLVRGRSGRADYWTRLIYGERYQVTFHPNN